MPLDFRFFDLTGMFVVRDLYITVAASCVERYERYERLEHRERQALLNAADALVTSFNLSPDKYLLVEFSIDLTAKSSAALTYQMMLSALRYPEEQTSGCPYLVP